MKNNFLLLLALLVDLACFAQETDIKTLAKFDDYYNASKYDSIFTMFSPETQVSLPLQKTKDFLVQLKADYGKLVKRTYIEYQAPFTVYKGEFEKGILALNLP